MSGGSIDIDDIQGDVSGVTIGSTGSLSAKRIIVRGNVINNVNPTSEVMAELRKILEGSQIENQVVTRPELEEIKDVIKWFMNLITNKTDKKIGRETQTIKAGNLQVSRNELLLKEANLKAYEHWQKGEYSNALIWYQKATQIEPSNASTWFSKGWVLDDLSRSDEAIQCYVKAINIDPNYADAWHSKAVALDDSERYNEAIECYDRAIKIDTNYANASNIKGISLRKIGQLKDADHCFAKAKELGLES